MHEISFFKKPQLSLEDANKVKAYSNLASLKQQLPDDYQDLLAPYIQRDARQDTAHGNIAQALASVVSEASNSTNLVSSILGITLLSSMMTLTLTSLAITLFLVVSATFSHYACEKKRNKAKNIFDEIAFNRLMCDALDSLCSEIRKEISNIQPSATFHQPLASHPIEATTAASQQPTLSEYISPLYHGVKTGSTLFITLLRTLVLVEPLLEIAMVTLFAAFITHPVSLAIAAAFVISFGSYLGYQDQQGKNTIRDAKQTLHGAQDDVSSKQAEYQRLTGMFEATRALANDKIITTEPPAEPTNRVLLGAAA